MKKRGILFSIKLPREVACDIDLFFGAEPRPFGDQLRGNVVHLIKHVSNRQRSESRHESPVSDFPIVLSWIGSEQAILNTMSHFL